MLPYHTPSTIPHAVFLPRTRLPFTWYSLSLPTTAKGIASYGQRHFTMVQCTKESRAGSMRWNKYPTCPSALTFCLECVSVWEIGSSWVERGGRGWKSWDKCVWKKKEWRHLLWSCHCRSCPPCPHQTLSVGKTQSRPSLVPSSPTAQNKARKQHMAGWCLQVTCTPNIWRSCGWQPVHYGSFEKYNIPVFWIPL